MFIAENKDVSPEIIFSILVDMYTIFYEYNISMKRFK